MNDEKTNIGLFFDGYYFYKLYKYYLIEKKKVFNVKLFVNKFIKDTVVKKLKIIDEQCDNVNGENIHFFIGGVPETKEEQLLEESLLELTPNIHRSPLRRKNDNESFLQEKGVDVFLAIKAVEDAKDGKYNTLVIVSGDADFVPLVRWSKQYLHNDVFGVYWNNDSTDTKASQEFIDSVTHKIDLMEELKAEDDYWNRVLFDEVSKNDEHVPATHPFKTSPSGTPANSSERPPVFTQEQLNEEKSSTIFSVKPDEGYGFIKSEHYYPNNKKWNNYYFSLDDVKNKPKDEVSKEWWVGKPVKFYRKFNEDYYKNTGVTLYMAIDVTLLED